MGHKVSEFACSLLAVYLSLLKFRQFEVHTLSFPCKQQLLLSADNLCKQFGARSGPTEPRSKLFDTLIVFLKEFLEKSQHGKLPSMLKSKFGKACTEHFIGCFQYT